ncbi:MAG: Gfo/Idh/MocA family oxidoreductase [Ruminococcaceae bacterium]|nr:Gfo/Idh/MocA family oxidoreductase [Oscillospiraceae bacterium]
MAQKLRIGIIGTGGIAHSHMRAYLRRIETKGDIEVVAGCDIIPGKAEAFFKEFGVEGVSCYESHEEMLDKEKLDGVSVCTYNRQHAAPTICALKHGINVILEKPFAVTLEECVEMMRAERDSGKILSVGFQPRFDKNMQQIKKIVESGELGDVYYIQTGGGRRRGIPAYDTKTTFIEEETAGVGALGDIGCYSLDMVLNAIGYPMPLTVSGFKTAYFGTDPETYRYKCAEPDRIASLFGVDDFAGALIRLEGGIVLDFRISWAMNIDTPGDTIILGTKAGLRIPSTDCWNGTVGGPMTIYRQCAGQSVQMEVPILKDSPADGNLWDRKIGSFVDAIRTGGKAPIPTSQIIKNQAIIDGIMRSSALGREVEINIPEI